MWWKKKTTPFSDAETEVSINCSIPKNVTMRMRLSVDNKASPIDYTFPSFLMQIVCIAIFTRLLTFILKPFRQPRVVAEIIAGILLRVLQELEWFEKYIFNTRSIAVLQSMADLGLVYFIFLLGVQMDLSVLRRTGKKAFIFAFCGMIVPFIISTFYKPFMEPIQESIAEKSNSNHHNASSHIILGVAASVTAFPVLARILVEFKLLNTELGRIAMTSAFISDMFAWFLVGLAAALRFEDVSPIINISVSMSSLLFILLCIFVIKPAIYWVIRHTPEGENFNEVHMCLILSGVLMCSVLSDFVGSHSFLGAFVYGIIIPNGPLGISLIEKLEDFVSGLLLPLYFGTIGYKTDMLKITGTTESVELLTMVVLCSAAKVVVILLLAIYYQFPFNEGLALGLLLNTKGLTELVALDILKDQEVLDESSFAIMVVASVAMTCIITPIVTSTYKPANRFVPYKRRTIQSLNPDSELRILACIHTPRNVPTMINLLEVSHPTKKSPISVYALHLVELTDRASAMLIVHKQCNSGETAVNRTPAQSDHIINLFDKYKQQSAGVSLQPLTAVSPYSTMHEDICSVAEDKRLAFIIVPFHKQQTVDGGMEVTNPAYRTINQNVLINAPCSVGILVDRGLSGSTGVNADHISHHIMVLFFGGPDDREALSYASRMAEHPGTSLGVIRFLPGGEAMEMESIFHGKGKNDLRVITDSDKEQEMDDNFIKAFQVKTAKKESIAFSEKLVNNVQETVAAIRCIDDIHDLYIVGREHRTSPLMDGLNDWSDCPELGAIGDVLASPDFGATASVLVVQQYVGQGLNVGSASATPDSPAQQHELYDSIRGTGRRQQRNENRPMPQRGMRKSYGSSREGFNC